MERWNEIDATLLKETRDKTGRLVGDDGDYWLWLWLSSPLYVKVIFMLLNILCTCVDEKVFIGIVIS